VRGGTNAGARSACKTQRTWLSVFSIAIPCFCCKLFLAFSCVTWEVFVQLFRLCSFLSMINESSSSTAFRQKYQRNTMAGNEYSRAPGAIWIQHAAGKWHWNRVQKNWNLETVPIRIGSVWTLDKTWYLTHTLQYVELTKNVLSTNLLCRGCWQVRS
jgi:hypothetical protein